MNERKLFQKNGITLIALVISIIVMLILAGVSLNATIGDNGIITKAQEATYMQSIAVLEEFLNNYYVENYEYFSNADNKAEALEQYTESSTWIWNPSKKGYGAIGYVVNSDGKACYFIDKSNLPNEIKNQLKGGDAGKGEYSDYASMNDVYGVTGDLKVYYSDGNKILGITQEELDLDNPLREVLPAGNPLAELILGDSSKGLTAEQAKSIKKLEINEESGITSLQELYNLTSLQELIIKNVSMNSLDGIQNAVQLKNVRLESSTINDYSALNNLNNIESLYFYFPPSFTLAQNEVDKILNNDIGITKGNFSKLEYFGIFGYDTIDNSVNFNTNRSNIDNLSNISNLSNETKNAIKYLYINNNNITNINFLEGFSNLVMLHCEINNLENLHGLNGSNKIETIVANNNNLGVKESESEKNSETDALSSLQDKKFLKDVRLQNNSNLKWCGYLENCTKISCLYLSGNLNFIEEDLIKLKDIYNNCMASKRSIDNKYISLFSTSNRINYSDKNLKDTSTEIIALKNNEDIVELCLDDNSELSNDKIKEILSTCKNIKTLSLRNLKNLTSIDFVKEMSNLLELDLRGTSVTDLSILEDITSLDNLYLSNENIDLTKIQNTINRLGDTSNSSGTFTEYASQGLIITSKNLIKKLENCKDITRLIMIYQSVKQDSGTSVDLSACNNLKELSIKNVNTYFKIPSSVSSAKFVQTSANYPADLSSANGLTYLQVGHCTILTQEQSTKWFEQISNCINLEKLDMYETGFSSLFGIEKLTKCLKLKTLNLFDYNYNYSIGDLSGIENLVGLTYLSIGGRRISDISPLSSLTNLETLILDENQISDISALSKLSKLKKLNLSNNGIVGLKPIEELKNLNSLDLSNNLLYDTSVYIDTDGQNKIYNNIEIIANLNKENGGNLEKIYLEGNNGIIDYSSIKKLSWIESSGF